jgi:hypothetical protein
VLISRPITKPFRANFESKLGFRANFESKLGFRANFESRLP